MKKNLLVFSISLVFASCNNASPENPDHMSTSADHHEDVIMEDEAEAMDYTDAIASIDKSREEIETTIESIKPIEVPSTGLREQVKQKWSKIHFYTKDGMVIRIKTYPYSEISKRTEEFYFENGKLVLAVIEDDGDGATKGREADEMSKMYYYQDGKLIHEINNTSEEETTIRQSDGERLGQEAKEYLEIYDKNKM